MPGNAPSTVKESLWQTPPAWTRTRAWPNPGSGMSRSTSSSRAFGWLTWAARMVAMVSSPAMHGRLYHSVRDLPTGYQDRFGAVGVREKLLERFDLRQVVGGDVGVVGVQRQEILMVVLGRVEGAGRLDAGGYRPVVDVGLIELRDVGPGDPLLLRAGREQRRAVLRADVRALAIALGRVVSDGEVDLQDTAVADPARVVGDLDRLRVAGAAGAHGGVRGRRRLAPGIAGDGAGDPLDVLEDALNAPEAAAGDDGDLGRSRLAHRLVESRQGNNTCLLGGRPSGNQSRPRPGEQDGETKRSAAIPQRNGPNSPLTRRDHLLSCSKLHR